MNKTIKDIKRRAGITETSDHSGEIQKLMHQLAAYLAEDLKNAQGGPGNIDSQLESIGTNLAQLVYQKLGA